MTGDRSSNFFKNCMKRSTTIENNYWETDHISEGIPEMIPVISALKVHILKAICTNFEVNDDLFG